MLTLYYRPAYCSMSSHIALRESGLPHKLARVDFTSGLTDTGEDYTLVNDKRQVPALRLPDGEILTESVAVLQYIADAAPDSGLAPPNGTLGRYRLQEWLNFLATEVHKRGSLLINRGTPEPMRATATEQLHQRLGWLEHKAGSQPYLVGERFSIADAHLLFLLHGMRVLMQLDFKPYPALTRRLASGLQRPAVREVLQIEQLSFPSID